jgi:hypothetical protein
MPYKEEQASDEEQTQQTSTNPNAASLFLTPFNGRPLSSKRTLECVQRTDRCSSIVTTIKVRNESLTRFCIVSVGQRDITARNHEHMLFICVDGADNHVTVVSNYTGCTLIKLLC